MRVLGGANGDTHRYANARHPYSFPRVTAMLGDGKTPYDHDNDGEAHSLGACSVRPHLHLRETK